MIAKRRDIVANCIRKLKRYRISTDRKLFEKFLKVVLGFLGLTAYRFLREFCRLKRNRNFKI